MTEPERVTPKEIFDKVNTGAALLVCAYDNEEKFKALHLEGAISLTELKSRLHALSENQEIIFYCA